MATTLDIRRTARPLTQGEVSVAQAMVQVLIDAGIDMVFGIPGGNMVAEGSLVDALAERQSEIRTVLVREESLAGVMAEVYGRLTRRPGVVFAQGAWLLNASMGALEAFMSSSPMLLLGDYTDGGPYSHHAPYQAGSGDYGSWDARLSFMGFTKRTISPFTPVQAVQDLQLGIKHAVTGQPGPVALLFHSSVLSGRVGPESAPALYATGGYLPDLRPRADEGGVELAAQTLATARRPVIIAGNGVRLSQAFEQLDALARRLAAPVATTAAGKGVFPETDALALGVFGTFGQPVANEFVSSADVLLVVGSKLGPTDTANENPHLIDPTRQVIIQVDVEPRNVAWTYPAQIALLGDARAVLGQLAANLPELAPEEGISRAAALERAKGEMAFFDSPQERSNQSPLLPQRIIRELQSAIAEDAIVCCDAGENRIFMTHYFQSRSPNGFIQSAGVGGMGYAIPAALAAKLVHPERQVLAVCGDGGFAMTMNGLMTAVEQRIPIVTLVFNNRSLGWVKHEQAERDRELACDFPDYDHAAIARAMGCVGIRVDAAADLGQALREALSCGQPAVIDIATSLQESFRRVTSPLLDRVAH
jgi:acetolactate synthase-1/2/3 large subunit